MSDTEVIQPRSPEHVYRVAVQFGDCDPAGIVFFQNEGGEAILVKAGQTFEELGRNRIGTGERTFASYAVAGPALILRTESAVYRIDPPR